MLESDVAVVKLELGRAAHIYRMRLAGQIRVGRIVGAQINAGAADLPNDGRDIRIQHVCSVNVEFKVGFVFGDQCFAFLLYKRVSRFIEFFEDPVEHALSGRRIGRIDAL